MNYNLLGTNNIFEPIATVLKNRGVEDIEKYLSPSEFDLIHYSKLKNIDKGVSLLLKHIDDKIAITVDPDVDGFTSAAQLYLALKELFNGIDVEYILPRGKIHDVAIDDIPQNTKLLITPDAGSNSFDLHKQLKLKGIDVLVIDHHESFKESEDAVVINNQLSDEYANKSLTGAGMVNKFIQALDDHLGTSTASNYLDLVALGLVADVANIKDDETRYLIWEGLKTKNNTMTEAMWKEVEFGNGGVRTPVDISFALAPKINAVVRLGGKEELDLLFKAFINHVEEKEYKYRGQIKQRSFQSDTLSKIKSVYNKQKKLKKDFTEELIEKVRKLELDKEKIILVEAVDGVPSTMNGLIAQNLTDEFQKPVALLRYNEENDAYAGSARGYLGTCVDFKSFIQNTGLVEYASGHANAFGVSIKKENMTKLIKAANKEFKRVSNEIITDVDFVFDATLPYPDFFFELDKSSLLFGTTVKEPVVVVENYVLDTSKLILSTSKKSLSYFHDGTKLSFFENGHGNLEDLMNNLIGIGDFALVNILGSCKIDRFRGANNPNMIVNKMEIIKAVELESDVLNTTENKEEIMFDELLF